MFNWFQSKPECPIDAQTREWVDQRWAWLESQFGQECSRKAPVVLPSPEFFPDRYDGSLDDARRILDRVCEFMHIDPHVVELSLHDDRNPLDDHPMFGGKWQGAAGFYQPIGGKFLISIEFAKLDDPLAMVATMAHEVGHVHLLGHGRISAEEVDHEPLTDLLTVYLGLGTITANSVVREEYWTEGYSSGWKIGSQGYLTMPVYGYALAKFARLRGEDGAGWFRELRGDVRSAFKQSMRLLAAEGEHPTAGGIDSKSN